MSDQDSTFLAKGMVVMVGGLIVAALGLAVAFNFNRYVGVGFASIGMVIAATGFLMHLQIVLDRIAKRRKR